MTKRTRRTHSGSFKAKVTLAALRGDKTLTEIAVHYEIHPNQVSSSLKRMSRQTTRAPAAISLSPVPGPAIA